MGSFRNRRWKSSFLWHDPIIYPVVATVNAKQGRPNIWRFCALRRPNRYSRVTGTDVRYWYKADIAIVLNDVCFRR
jgi:hypothetical protein